MASSNSGGGFNGSFFSRLISAISQPIRSFREDAFAGRGSSMSGSRSAGQNVIHWLTAPFRFLVGVAVFLVQAWATSRSGLAFLVGIPAVLTIGVFLLAVWIASVKVNRLYGCVRAGYMNSIQRAAEPKMRASAIKEAAMFAEQLADFRPESEEDKYELGVAKGRAGNISEALDIMKLLAPDDQPGYSDAHLWRAGFYQDPAWFQASDEKRDELVLKQLDLAIQQQPDNKAAHAKMTVIHLRKALTYEEGSDEQRMHWQEGLDHSAAMVNSGIDSIAHLVAVLRVVDLQKKLHGLESARKTFRKLYTDILQPTSQKFPNVLEIWVVMVQCAVALEDIPMAKQFIRDGLVTSNSNDVRIKINDLSPLVLVHEADIAEDMNDPSDYQSRLYALMRAISVAPRNKEAYKRLAKFIDSGSEEHFNMLWFEEAKVAAPDPGAFSTMLGLRALMDGKDDVAKTHWRVSRQLYTLSELVLNHLILVGSNQGLADFSDPIDLYTRTLEAFPDNPVLLQSRGYFLIKEGRQQEAIRDLETAVEKLPAMFEARQFLILLYEQMGDSNLAAHHRQQRDDALAKLPEASRVALTEKLERVEL